MREPQDRTRYDLFFRLRGHAFALRQRSRRDEGRRFAMHERFELYLHHRDGGPGRFKVVTCPRERVLDHARELLEGCEGKQVEVRSQGEHLFTIVK